MHNIQGIGKRDKYFYSWIIRYYFDGGLKKKISKMIWACANETSKYDND